MFLEERNTWRNVLRVWLLRVGIAAIFIFIGTNKFAAHSEWVGLFERIGFGQWFRYFTGMLQITGATLVLIPKTFSVGIVILACTMLGAMGAWVFFLGNPVLAIVPGGILLGLLAVGGSDVIDLIAS